MLQSLAGRLKPWVVPVLVTSARCVAYLAMHPRVDDPVPLDQFSPERLIVLRGMWAQAMCKENPDYVGRDCFGVSDTADPVIMCNSPKLYRPPPGPEVPLPTQPSPVQSRS